MKRVIGVGGDAVACVDGTVEVNGVALDEARLRHLARPGLPRRRSSRRFPRTGSGSWATTASTPPTPACHIGDPGGGFIPVDDVVGKVFVVVWPIKHWGFIHRPGTFDNPALDQAAGLVSTTAPVGLALVGIGPLYRRLRLSTKRTPD